MTLDLEPIKARAEAYAEVEGRWPENRKYQAIESAEDVPALIAEVERLRAGRAS